MLFSWIIKISFVMAAACYNLSHDRLILQAPCHVTQTIVIHLPLVPRCASVNWVSIGLDNGLLPVRRQAITWTNAHLLSIRPSGTNFSEIWIKIQNFHSRKSSWKHWLQNSSHFVQGVEVTHGECRGPVPKKNVIHEDVILWKSFLHS